MIKCSWLSTLPDISDAQQLSIGSGIIITTVDGRPTIHRIGMPPSSPAVDRVTEASCGISHALLRTADGVVYSVGRDAEGQCGGGPAVDDLIDCLVIHREADRIATGATSSFILARTGVLLAFGCNKYGQLGLVSAIDTVRQPTPVPGLPQGISVISSGYGHTCVIADGVLYGCGLNSHGQLEFITGDLVQIGFQAAEFPIRLESVACGVWSTAVVTLTGEVFVAGKAPRYQAGPLPLSHFINRPKTEENEAHGTVHGWTRLDSDEDIVEIHLGSSIGVALARDRRTILIINLEQISIESSHYVDHDVRSVSVNGRWWGYV